MRVVRHRSIAVFATGFALGTAGALGQTRPAPPAAEPGAIVTPDAARATPQNNKNAEDIEFLVDALRTSLAEIELGELATQRSYDPRVREYGTKLKTDHTAQAAELERILRPLDVTIPAEPSAQAQAHRAALERLAGQQFDAAFVELMIASHREAIEQYGAQTHANPDRTLADFATRSLPLLKQHLAQAEALR